MPAVANAVFGGWSLGSIVTAASGRPFSVINQGNPANTGTYDVVSRPNVLSDPYAHRAHARQGLQHRRRSSPRRRSRSALSAATPCGGRGFFNWDFSAHKEFQLLERLRAQFRFESFHFTNTPRFGAPGATMGTATFGKINSADVPPQSPVRPEGDLVGVRSWIYPNGRRSFELAR